MSTIDEQAITTWGHNFAVGKTVGMSTTDEQAITTWSHNVAVGKTVEMSTTDKQEDAVRQRHRISK